MIFEFKTPTAHFQQGLFLGYYLDFQECALNFSSGLSILSFDS